MLIGKNQWMEGCKRERYRKTRDVCIWKNYEIRGPYTKPAITSYTEWYEFLKEDSQGIPQD